jgi:hypothetical protein
VVEIASGFVVAPCYGLYVEGERLRFMVIQRAEGVKVSRERETAKKKLKRGVL